jgi:ABC-type nitrate/sulfonate/bicarbonate transport system permease component
MRKAAVWQWTIVIAAVVSLELLCRYGVISRLTMTAPSDVALRLVALLRQPKYVTQISTTLYNILISVVLGIVIGFAVAVVLYRTPRVRRAVQPLLASYFALPFFVLYPLLVVLLGMNSTPIVAIASLAATIAMVISTLDGLDRIPPVLRKASQGLRLGRLQTSLLVELPATLPYLFTGAKLAIAYAVTSVIGAEFILSGAGLGYSISFAYNNFDNATMYALLLFVIVFVTLLLMLLNVVERRLRYSAASGASTAPAAPLRATHAERWLDTIIVTVLFLGCWQALHLLSGGEALASPWTTLKRIGTLLESPVFYTNVAETFRALGIALVISCLGGAVIGALLGAGRLAGAIVEPMIVALQSIPKVTLYPVFLLFFGLGLAAKVAFGVIHGAIPVALVTLNAVRTLNPALKRTARAFHLTSAQTLVTIYVPATIPEIVTAVRLGFCLTFLGVMLGELFASKRGLGYMIMNGIAINDVPTMIAVTAMVGIFAIVVNNALLWLEGRLRR